MENPVKLEIIQGMTKTYELRFQEDGIAIDITGWTVYFTVKEAMNDLDAVAKIDKTITSFDEPTQGIAEIELSTTDTNITVGNYYFSVDVKTDDSDEFSVVEGRLRISKPVRQSRS